MAKQKVVITGIGVVSPIGIGLENFWRGLLESRCGIGKISLFDAESFPCRIAAEVRNFDATPFMTPREQRAFSRATQFALSAYELARKDSGLTYLDPARTSVILGTSMNAFDVMEEQIMKNPGGIQRFNEGVGDPMGLLRTALNGPACAVALRAGAENYVTTVSSACASGLDAVGQAFRRVENDDADMVICGSVDTPITRLIYAGFCSANFLSTRNETPEEAVAPFDISHERHVLGEGASVFILENEKFARARGARSYARISQFALETENVNQYFLLDKSGEKWRKVIERALQNQKPDHVNAHAPSDKSIDIAEARAIAQVVAAATPVTSIKGSVGQGMSSAGGFQIAAAANTIHTGIIPPIRNHRIADDNSPLLFVTETMRRKVGRVLISSHGIGGINSAIMLEEP